MKAIRSRKVSQHCGKYFNLFMNTLRLSGKSFMQIYTKGNELWIDDPIKMVKQ